MTKCKQRHGGAWADLLQGVHVPDTDRAIAGRRGEVAPHAVAAECQHAAGVRPHQRVVAAAAHVQVTQVTGGGGGQYLEAVRLRPPPGSRDPRALWGGGGGGATGLSGLICIGLILA